MSKKFLTAVDLVQNELQNGRIQNLSTAPTSPQPVKGQVYFNTTDSTLYWCEVGGASPSWISARGGGTGFPGFGAVTQEQLFGSTKVDGSAGTAARADHMHGNPVHDAITHSGVPLNILAQPTGVVNMGAQLITNLAQPVAGSDAANKTYVDNLTFGMSWKEPVRVATTANITLSGTQTIDGVAVVVGNRVLVKNQTSVPTNGIYTVAAGAWARDIDADSESDILNASVFVSEGTTLADTAWVMTANAPITMGTTNITWVQFAGTGGAVPPSRLINTTAPLTGGGDLSTDRTLAVSAATETAVGVVELATGTETLAGTDNTRACHPAGVGAVAAVLAQKSLALTAGNGLTGGGDLSANRTFDVGAGTGITVAVDSVGLDLTYLDARYVQTANGIKRYAADVGGAVSQVLTHNLNTRDVEVQLYRNTTPWDTVECDVERTSTTQVTLRFTVAPSAAEYRAVVLA